MSDDAFRMISLTCDSEVICWISPPLRLKSRLQAVLIVEFGRDDCINDDDVFCKKARW